jgi:hypothetical protein
MEVQHLGKPMTGPSNFLADIQSRSRYEWKPPYQLTRLPSWFKLSLDCYVTTSGTRRFTLVEPSEADLATPGLPEIASARGLSLVASIGGYHLLRDRGEVDPDLLLTHDEARLFLQYIEHRREYIGNRKGLEEALGVCEGGRVDASIKNVLPDRLGLDDNGQGTPWKVPELRNVGLRAAEIAGLSDPTARQVLSYGLLEAAKLNPMHVRTVEHASSLMRMTLFALADSSDTVSTEQLKYVAVHVRKSLQRRLDDTDEQFKSWLKDPDSNLLHQIAKRRDCPMSRPQVKRALLELGWRTLVMLGECIDMQMRTFRDAIPDALNEVEDFYFSQTFLGNPCYGGLPLLLLQDRFDDLSAAVVNVWNKAGDPSAIDVLHRVMYYNAELYGNRRAADRQYKRRSQARNASGQLAKEETIDYENQKSRAGPMPELFLDVAKAIAVDYGIDTDAGEWEASLVSHDDAELKIEMRRAEPHFVRSFTVPRKDFEAMARKMRDLDSE